MKSRPGGGDGYDLQTAVGKLTGPDPNGPTVPLRGGKWDVGGWVVANMPSKAGNSLTVDKARPIVLHP
ncbi:MAG: hypothetical protein WBV82_30095 [Myxococcaceae bacterium]